MKKKRLALGLLLSVVLVAALNGAYFKRLPINVMLEVSGKGCGAATANFSKKAEGDYSSRYKQKRARAAAAARAAECGKAKINFPF